MSKGRKHYRPVDGTKAPAPDSKPVPKNDTPNLNQTPAKTETKETAGNENFDVAMLRWTRVVGLFTAVLAIVGAVQAWSFIQSERAYLTVTNPSFIDGFVPNKQMVLMFLIKNTGRSPAELRNVAVTTKEKLIYPLKYDKMFEIGASPVAVGASEPYIYKGLNEKGDPFLMSEATISGVNSGNIKLYVFGFADYVDDFSVFGSRRSYFCYLYNPERSTPQTTAFNSCPVNY